MHGESGDADMTLAEATDDVAEAKTSLEAINGAHDDAERIDIFCHEVALTRSAFFIWKKDDKIIAALRAEHEREFWSSKEGAEHAIARRFGPNADDYQPVNYPWYPIAVSIRNTGDLSGSLSVNGPGDTKPLPLPALDILNKIEALIGR